MTLFNKMQIFGTHNVTVFHDVFDLPYAEFHNIIFKKVNFQELVDTYNKEHGLRLSSSFNNRPFFERRRLSDIVRLLLCTENCFYFDTDTFFFKYIDFDFLVYEPFEKRSANNGIYRLSDENNRFLETVRGYLNETSAIEGERALSANYEAFNYMKKLWTEYYPNFPESLRVLEIPIVYHLLPFDLRKEKGKLMDDLRFYSRYSYFYHCYEKEQMAIVFEGHRRLFSERYDDAVLGDLNAFLASLKPNSN